MNFIHRFVPGSSTGARTLVMLHGTGGDETSLFQLGPMLDPDAPMLGVRGTSTEEGMNRYFRRFSEGLFDEADIQAQAANLSEFLAEAKTTYGLNELVLVGYSNGANMAAALLLLHPAPFAAAILFRATLPLMPQSLPSLHGKRILLLTGSYDSMIPLDGAKQLAEVLRECGAEVDQRLAPVGHELRREDVTTAAEWLNVP
jgi:phospholipase/carboxylesterase